MPRSDGQFRKGRSGNPGGRPKTKAVTELIRDRLGKGEAKEIAEALIAQAKSGDIKAIKELLDRVEGKAVQPATLTGDVTIRVEYADLNSDAHGDAAPAPPGTADDPRPGEAV